MEVTPSSTRDMCHRIWP